MRHLYVIALILFSSAMAQVSLLGPSVAPSACAWPSGIPPATYAALCSTTDPKSPWYAANAGGPFLPMTAAQATLSQVNCTSITGTLTLASGGAATLTNASGTGCTFK